MNRIGIGDLMYEGISIVGERGQITIPKIIREKEHIKEKDQLRVIDNNGLITIEKIRKKDKKEIRKLLKERYQKYAKLDEQTMKDFEHADRDANRFLDEY